MTPGELPRREQAGEHVQSGDDRPHHERGLVEGDGVDPLPQDREQRPPAGGLAQQHQRQPGTEEGDAEQRDTDTVEEQVAFPAKLLDGVRAEGLEPAGDAVLRRLHRVRDRPPVLDGPRLRPPRHRGRPVPVDPDLTPSLTAVSTCRADVVDQRDARIDQMPRSEVRVAAGDRRRRVDDRDHAGLDEGDGRGAVHVDVVDDRDLPGV